MKVFAAFTLLAVVAYASDHDPHTMLTGMEYVGDLQDVAGGPIIKFGEYKDCKSIGPVTVMATSSAALIYGIPSCKLGGKTGNAICFAKCIARKHKGGACKGKKCVCVD